MQTNTNDYDLIFKMLLIGDAGVGKSNLLLRFLKDEFMHESKSTIGVEFGSKMFYKKDTRIKVQIWDTAGQERYKSITNAYYKGAKGALLVFDLTRENTFMNLDKWLIDLKNYGDEDVSILMIGNKADLVEQRVILTNIAQIKAQTHSKINY